MSTFSTSNKEPLDHLVNVANKAMHTAGEIILTHYNNLLNASSDTNWQNIATEAETAMISVILSHSTRHTVYGKQTGWNNCIDDPIMPEFVWVIDPINGSTDGLLPTFGTSVALLHNGIPLIGCINNPIAGIKTIGRRDAITTRNGECVTTRAYEDLGKAYIDINEPDYNEDAKAAYRQLEYRVAEIFFNGSCISYSELAAGMLQAVVHTAVDPCGFLALIPIVEGAGGVITDWQGNQLSWQPSPTSSIPQDGFNVVASADPRTHEQILSAIS